MLSHCLGVAADHKASWRTGAGSMHIFTHEGEEDAHTNPSMFCR
jgi:hypothetical protein